MRWRNFLTLCFLAAAAAIFGPALSFAQRSGAGGNSGGASGGGGGLQVRAQDFSRARAGAMPGMSLGEAPGDVYRAVAAMVEAGQWNRADALLRSALIENPDDDIAAQALRDMYRLPGVLPLVDESEVSRTQEQLGPGYSRYETDHFVALSNCDPQWTRQRVDLLERTYHQFHRVMKRLDLQNVPPRNRLLCVLIEDHAAYTAFARDHDGVDAAWVAGYYASRTNRVVFYNDATGPAFRSAAEQIDQFRKVAQTAERRADTVRGDRADQSAAALRAQAKRFKEHLSVEQSRLREQVEAASITKTIHEATHLIAFNCGLQSRAHQYPFWLTEGLATSFETLDPDGAFGPDTPMEARDQEFAQVVNDGLFVPTEAFIQMNSLSGADADTARAMYAEAQALFKHMFRYERERLAAYFRDIQREPAGAISPRRHGEMFLERFGRPERIEREWLREAQRSILADVDEDRTDKGR